MDPEVMHELERLEDLRKQLEKRVEQLAERVDMLEAERIKVSYPPPGKQSSKFRRPRDDA